MEKVFKLKKDVRKFFDKKFHDSIYPLSVWRKECINENILDELPAVYVILGHESQRKDYKSSSISGWCKEGGKFHFTKMGSDKSTGNSISDSEDPREQETEMRECPVPDCVNGQIEIDQSEGSIFITCAVCNGSGEVPMTAEEQREADSENENEW